jgi:hypothetical protein
MGGLFGESKQEKEEFSIINRLLGIIENLTGAASQKLRPALVFNIFNENQKLKFMAQVSALTLTSAAPVQLFMTVVDPTGNVIGGVASGFAYAPADPTQDIAVVDPSIPTDVDVHAVSPTGGTTVVATCNFVSTLLQADGVTPVFSGPLTSLPLTLTNNIAVTTLTPSLVFNQ